MGVAAKLEVNNGEGVMVAEGMVGVVVVVVVKEKVEVERVVEVMAEEVKEVVVM